MISIYRYCSHKKWQITLGDAGTTDRFGLTFQYQIFFFFFKWTKTIANEKYYKMYKYINANTSAIYMAAYAAHTTN